MSTQLFKVLSTATFTFIQSTELLTQCLPDTPARLKRFDTLKAELNDRILPQRVLQAMQPAAKTVDALQFAYGKHDPDRFNSLDHAIKACLIKFIIQKVKIEPLCLPDEFVLTEDAETHQRRLMLEGKLHSLTSAEERT